MQSATVFRKQKDPETCADCGQLSKRFIPSYNRFTGSEVRLCPSCATWHKTEAQLRAGYCGVLLPHMQRPWQ